MNQFEKEKNKLAKELITKTNKSIKKRTYEFKYVDKSNSEGFENIFDSVVNEINKNADKNGFVLEYDREEKRSATTLFNLFTVYTVKVTIASDTEKFLAKTEKARARDGDEISW